MSKFNPAKLNPQTACSFTVGNHINYARLKGLVTFLKRTLPRNYRGIQGRTLYFEYADAKGRDDFLAALQAALERDGLKTERIN